MCVRIGAYGCMNVCMHAAMGKNPSRAKRNHRRRAYCVRRSVLVSRRRERERKKKREGGGGKRSAKGRKKSRSRRYIRADGPLLLAGTAHLASWQLRKREGEGGGQKAVIYNPSSSSPIKSNPGANAAAVRYLYTVEEDNK